MWGCSALSRNKNERSSWARHVSVRCGDTTTVHQAALPSLFNPLTRHLIFVSLLPSPFYRACRCLCRMRVWLYPSAGSKLHDDVPPMTARRVSNVLSRELDAPPEEVFSSLNLTHPVGSASISQVWHAELRHSRYYRSVWCRAAPHLSRYVFMLFS